MSDVIKIKSVESIKVELAGNVHSMVLPSMKALRPFLGMESEKDVAKAMDMQFNLLELCGIPKGILEGISPYEFQQVAEVVTGLLKKT